MAEQKLNIIQKLSGIRKMAAAVKKSADGYNYTYPPEDEVLANVTAGMNKYGVGLHLSVDPNYKITPFDYDKVKKNKQGEIISSEKINEWLFEGTAIYEWINEEDPNDRIEATWPLIGQQTDASQAFGSATTYCNRYFMLKYFQTATVKDDPDAYRSKQKSKEDADNIEKATNIITAMHVLVNDFVQKFPDKREAISAIVKKYVVVKKKPSSDYFQVTDPDVALKLQEEIINFITETQKGNKKA